MKPADFIVAIDDAAVVAAIAAAEQNTSGELRVFVSGASVDDPVAAARSQFVRLKMNQTRQRNGVLIFLAPESRKLAIVGDIAVHERCGQTLWDQTAADLAAAFGDTAYTQGLIQIIQKIGALLAEHFPHTADDQNELPDLIERD